MAQNSIWTMTDLTLANTRYADSEHILVMSAESLDLIEAIAQVAASVTVQDTSFLNLQRVRTALGSSKIVLTETPFTVPEGKFDTAILFVPKGRDLVRTSLWHATRTLKIGGDLYLVGPNDGGVKTAMKDAETLFGNCNLVAYKKSHRIARAINPEQASLPQEWAHNIGMRYFSADTITPPLEIASQAGVFSWNEVDPGTRFLLDHLKLQATDTVLDLGCGNGIIGATIASRVQHVTLSDDNLLALACARETLHRNQISNAVVLASDVYTQLGDQRFDVIVSNPPFHQQFDQTTRVTERMIQQAPDHLNRGGKLLVVANAFLKYEPLFEEHFRHTHIIARDNRYKIIEGVV